MNDVAQRAGVSHQTVSRVLNEHPSVRPTTRQRVLLAIEELGYRRNLSARALVTRRSGVIGVVTTGSAYIGPASTTNAIEVAARGRGYATQLAVLEQQDGTVEAFEHLVERAVEGIVVVAPQSWLAETARAAASTVPVVMAAADRTAATGRRAVAGVHLAAVDQELGGRMAVRHLLNTGRRVVAHVRGPVGWFDADERARAWSAELEEAGLDPGPQLEGDWTPRSGYQAGVRLLADGLPESVFVGNDHMALGLLRALADRGVRVPEDIAVVGFDDIDGTEYFRPALTTVRQPFGDLGRLCLEVLVDAMAGSAAESSTIAPTLVVRESTRGTDRPPGSVDTPHVNAHT